jgi:hypothetical protein
MLVVLLKAFFIIQKVTFVLRTFFLEKKAYNIIV